MFEQEQAQLRTPATACWSNLDLQREVTRVREAAIAGQPLHLHDHPSCVLMLLDDPRLGPCPQNVKDLITSRIQWFRKLVQDGHSEFALGNQPQYVIDRVMTEEVTENKDS